MHTDTRETKGLMRVTVSVDDALLERAKRITGLSDHGRLFEIALRTLVERECSWRLARLGGTEPRARMVRRRRSSVSSS